MELTLRTTEEGPRLFAEPVREIELLHGKRHTRKDQVLKPGDNVLSRIKGELLHIRCTLAPDSAQEMGLVVRGVPVTYDVAKGELRCLDKTAPLKLEEGRISLEILVDRVAIEIFANDGRVYMPMGILLEEDNRSLETFVRGGSAKIRDVEIFELRSAWE